jgi:hypothetical protein
MLASILITQYVNLENPQLENIRRTTEDVDHLCNNQTTFVLQLPILLLLPRLRKHNRSPVHMTRPQKVVRHTNNSRRNEHDTRPIEILNRQSDLTRPERPKECESRVKQRTRVDSDAPFA